MQELSGGVEDGGAPEGKDIPRLKSEFKAHYNSIDLRPSLDLTSDKSDHELR